MAAFYPLLTIVPFNQLFRKSELLPSPAPSLRTCINHIGGILVTKAHIASCWDDQEQGRCIGTLCLMICMGVCLTGWGRAGIGLADLGVVKLRRSGT